MRKFYAVLLLTLVFLASKSIQAQNVSTYSFSQSTTAYTPITGGAVLGTTSSDDQYFVDPAVPAGGTTTTGTGFPIGFNFTYAGNTYDRVAVNNNGWISLGSSALTPSTSLASTSAYTPLSSTTVITPATLRARIAAVGRDLQAQSGAELRIQTIGTAPNRQLIVQWTNYKRFGTSGTGDNFNFQIILTETSNTVQVKFGSFVFGTTSTTTGVAHIGLGGTTATDFNNRTTVTPHDWNTTLAGTTNADGAQVQTTTIPVTPPNNGLTFTWTPPSGCTGTPAGGTAQTTASVLCSPTLPFTLSVTGATSATGLTYQWQSSPNNSTWTDISGATAATLNVTGVGATTYYRRRISCGANSSFSASVMITVTAAVYTTLPYAESFESDWIDGCNTKDIPNNFWRNNPATGDNSWRRNDDATTTNSGAWTGTTLGAYTPGASAGAYSARFHTYEASSGSKGQLDLFVNCNNGSVGKQLSFDYINTDGNDSLVVYISTNGGASFTRLDGVLTATTWTTATIVFGSTSATTVIRFEATSDFGFTDIGLDNLSIASLPNCSGTPTGGAISSTGGSTCGTPFTLTVSGGTDPLATYGLLIQWQQSTDGGATWVDIGGATFASYSSTGSFVATQYRRKITCSASGLFSYSTVFSLTGISPTYATLPFTESFENNWQSICDVNDAPNNSWRNSPPTGNPSWRRQDDGATANWTVAGTGLYTPVASAGNFSARFHTYFAPTNSKGQLNLYLNAATATATKRLSFDYTNLDGTDSLAVYLSTNNGASFTRLGGYYITGGDWQTKQIVFTSTSATTIIRFEATSDFGSGTAADIGLDNINVIDFPNCSGTPLGGTAAVSVTPVCPSNPFTLSVAGATDAAGITYQWQSSPDGTTWTNIAGATGATYTAAGIIANTQYRRVITCSGTASSNSAAVTVSVIAPAYATLPYAESFENTWASVCATRDAPNNFWRSLPGNGVASWRRNDDGVASGAWQNVFGNYTPEATQGVYSARFHSYQTATGQKGSLNLYVNAATASATKRLTFDYINTTGTDSLSILLSTDGGNTFVRLDSAGLAAAWRTKTIVFNATSATAVLRFEATGLVFSSDIGIDNLNLVDFPDCSGTPVGGTTVSSFATVCPSTPFGLSVTGATDASGITYQWQVSTNGGTTWTNISGATGATYASPGVIAATSYRRQILCGANSSFSSLVTVAINAPTYAALPFAESFENTWINGCGVRDIPNNSWRNNPVSGNSSWRRNDDGDAAGWTNSGLWAYSPDASAGQYSARFHSAEVTTRTNTGLFDLYINAATASALKRLSFDYINMGAPTGTDSVTISVSTDGGATFTRLDSVRFANIWTTKTIDFTSSSATTVIRFTGTGDFGTTDIGIDNILVTDFAPCTAAPVAGTAISSSTSVCAEAFTLSLQGSTSGSGIVYQWQRSTTNTTGSWTDIPGATGFTYTTTQAGSTWYRARVTCTNSNESSFSTPVQVISPTLVSGTFTINNALPTTAPTNFKSFNDAYNYIKCGVNGPVVFNVVDNAGTTGVYNEQLIMLPVPGTSTTNTVTFKGRGATLAFSANNSNERAVIKLRGADFIRFDSLIINASSGTYGYGVQLISNADSNIISNCTINTNTTATTTNYVGIVINGTEAGPTSTGTVLCDANQFIGNTINGGYYGITLVSSTTGPNVNNQYLGNKIRDFYLYGIYVNGSQGTVLEGNTISRPTRTAVSDFYGIYFTGVSERVSVSKNKITNPFGGALTSTLGFYGIYFTGVSATPGNENAVTNNLIYKINGQGVEYGIYNSGSGNVSYFHNTIALDSVASTSTSLARGFYQTGAAGGIVIGDNIITITRGGTGAKHAIYMGTNTTGFNADYNDYYLNAPAGTNSVGYFNADRTTLSLWQAATGKDAHSISRNPFYALSTPDDYKPTNGAVDNKGIYVGIDTDILNVARDQSRPDIGAFEFTGLPCTLPPDPGNTLFDDTTVCQNSPVRLNLTLQSWGSAQTFQWQTATSAAGPWTALGGVRSDPDTVIVASTSIFYRAATTCGGTTVFSNPIQLLVSPALPTGTYTINKGGTNTYVPGTAGGNFTSFNTAKAAMSCGIVGGPVVMNVVAGSGPYLEQLRLDSIPGTSPVNTITFNGNGNTINFNAITNTNERAVIKLSGADFITFDSLRIDASGGTTYGYGVQLQNNADSNTFRRCAILSSTTSTSTNYAGIVINALESGATTNGATNCDGNKFDRDSIIGGYYGVTLMGGTTALAYINNNQFTNNQIREFYNYGFYLGGTGNTIIEGNTFTRPVRSTTASSVYGVYATAYNNSNLRISKNRFTRFFGGVAANTATFYGVYHNNVDANAGSENIISNNLIYSIDGNGPMYGFYNSGSDNIFYYHNTISFDNAASAPTGLTAGLYQTTAATGIFVRNNIVTVNRGGTGSKYAIYVAQTAATEVNSNNNDYYVTGANANVGFYGAAQATLAQWQTASLQDAASFSLNPLYTDTLNGNYRPQLAAIDNQGKPVSPAITTDILNAPRSTTTPDLGAYEYAPIPCANPPIAGTATVTPSTGICLESPIHLSITGNSPLGNITFQWQSASVAGGPWTNVSGVQYFPDFDTVTTLNTFYRAAVTCNGNTVYTNTVSVTLNPLLVGGTYTINPTGTGSNNFTSFQAAVTAMLCGITGPVVLNVEPGTYNEQILIPYIPNTSAVNTVTFQSRTGVPASVTLGTAATNTSNYTLRLSNTRWFTFRNLSFAGTNAAAGRVVELFDSASNNSFVNNVITAPAVTVTGTSAAGIYAATFKGRNNLIRNNTVTGGAAGIYIAGTSVANLNQFTTIDSNNVLAAYQYGIYTGQVKRINLNTNNVSVGDTLAPQAYGIYATDADSAFTIRGNNVTFANTGVTPTVYGIYVTNSDSATGGLRSLLANNKVVSSGTANKSSAYGIYINNSPGAYAVNNVVALNTNGANSYGLYHNATTAATYYNNSIQSTATSAANNYAAYFNNTAATFMSVRNNVFSHKGGGRAMYVANAQQSLLSDYNLLYTSGAVLVQSGTPVGSWANLNAWKNAAFWDLNSIVYTPAFVSNTDLRPDVNNPDVWAMHGRGVQIAGNNADINGAVRPTTLYGPVTGGVPDLGAYEFYPAVQPTLLTATPATPAPNATQTFMYGTDTVMKITWGSTAPPTAGVRRYSGVVPPGLTPTTDSMYFYTQVEVPGSKDYNNFNVRLHYLDPWQGSIADQNTLGLGKTISQGSWTVGFSSRVDVSKKVIFQNGLSYVDKFTGLFNPYAPPVIPDKDSSNRGRRFWVAYPVNQLAGGQDMVLYLAAQENANVQVRINGTNWVRNYFVPANTVKVSDILPKTGVDNAFINVAGQSNRGISITADVPIVAYSHVYGAASSGASMLLPVGVWGYEYQTLGITQNYGANSFAYYYVIADNDSTWVQVTSRTGIPLQPGNAGVTPGTASLVKLNKGEFYQVVASSQTDELSGSLLRSVPNNQGKCYPIAVYSGSSRTAIDVGCGSGGDFIMQQNFPSTAWGKRYLTAPTSASSTASNFETNIYRVAVKDPTTVVKRNGFVLTGIQSNFYYQFNSNTADYIEADKPIMVAQFEGGSCDTYGDPEMIYLSPIEQGINSVAFYRNTQQAIQVNYLTLIVPKNGTGLTSLVITDGGTVVTPDYTYDHPNLSGYKVVVKRWTAAQQQVRVQSDSAFTAITYGQGSVESYGYNAGTLVKTLRALGSINNTLNTSGTSNDFTCSNAPFRFTAILPLKPTTLTFKFSLVPGLSPNADVTLTNPTPTDSSVINGRKYYFFKLAQDYTFASPGLYAVRIDWSNPEIESCDKTAQDVINVQVVPAPNAGFTYSPSAICTGNTVQFTGEALTANGVVVNGWQWTFHTGSTATGQTTSFTYPTAGTFDVKLRSITPDGCLKDSIRTLTINPRPVVTLVQDSVNVCPGTSVTFTVQSPVAGVTYNWFTAQTGGTPVSTGISYTVPVTTNAVYWVEGVSSVGCNSTTRTRARVFLLGPLATPAVRVASVDVNSVTFTWDPVPGAASYEVSVRGAAFVPANGLPALTHTVTGLRPLDTVSVVVRALGILTCQTSISPSVTGRSLPDQIYIPNSFSPNGDGLNDKLLVYGYTIKDMKFDVFNQWGEKIFESASQNTGWDGIYKGKAQPSGVYIYVARFTLKDGSVVERKGTINLVR